LIDASARTATWRCSSGRRSRRRPEPGRPRSVQLVPAVRHDDLRALAAAFQHYVPQVAVGGVAQKLAADLCRPGERHHVEVDIEFHAALMNASKDRQSHAQLACGWNPFLVWFPERELYAGLPPDLVERHREVLVALQSRDQVVCDKAISNHMAQKRADITH
jgi:hypothetical protein